VCVHCGAIPETLVESELFGHEKGAFTGAHRSKRGRFELAGNGTIFLDEIGTITNPAQVKLLQVLQDGTYSRVGSEEGLHTNARVVAATNADLHAMTETGRFRRDLLYRLNIFPIILPPLRERLEDLPHLVDFFLDALNRKYGKKIRGVSQDVLECLMAYDWPGNLRELENILERAHILQDGDRIETDVLPAALMLEEKVARAIYNHTELPLARARQVVVEEFERVYLIKLLTKNRGKIGASAREAGITTRQLRRLAGKYDLDKNNYKG
jgi:transcriptional regulator with GAF, ATPase, and Fis domain